MIKRALLMCGAAVLLAGCGDRHGDIEKEMAAYQASADAAAATNLKAGQDYLAKVAKEPGIITLPSGLMYKVVSNPDPAAPQPSVHDTVTVNYEGALIDGHVFDSSYARNQPATFPLDRVILGWQTSIPLMHVGDTFMLYVPPKLGYGEQDQGSDIPANSVLVFKVQLLGINGK